MKTTGERRNNSRDGHANFKTLKFLEFDAQRRTLEILLKYMIKNFSSLELKKNS